MEDITHPWSQGQEVAGLGLRALLPVRTLEGSFPVRAASGPGAGRGLPLHGGHGLHRHTHGARLQCHTRGSVRLQGWDEPDEVPAPALGPERKPRRCPDACRAPCLPGVPLAPCPPHPSPPVTPPHSRCHPLLLRARTLQCARGGCPVDLPERGIRGPAGGAHPLGPHIPHTFSWLPHPLAWPC